MIRFCEGFSRPDDLPCQNAQAKKYAVDQMGLINSKWLCDECAKRVLAEKRVLAWEWD